MIYKRFAFFLLIRVIVLVLLLLVAIHSWNTSIFYISIAALTFFLLLFWNLYKFLVRRFKEIDDFFEAVQYRDFSRRFVEDHGSPDIRKLHKGFNEVNKVVREINSKKEIQYLYLQKILELVDVGILAYEMDSGEVLWSNDAIRNTLNLPSFKRISFVKKRKPEIFSQILKASHPEPTTITLSINHERIKVLVSDSVFRMEEQSYKLIVLQNIDETLNQNESEAWKKLLSVMTHEIMNSIAPISSLAETLHQQVRQAIENPGKSLLNPADLDLGISSIRNRSEGLMKFAKTYRSLNKVTQLNLSLITVGELFDSIENFMIPSLRNKKVEITFLKEHLDLVIEIDSYLVEQVMINIILNAVEATSNTQHPKIIISAKKNTAKNVVIKIADNGCGIPEEILETVFVPFFTTKKTGSGIGLSLSKQIMLLHKGKILIHSIEGQGTVVKLLF